MSYYTEDGFRLGGRRERLPKEHFGFTEAASRLGDESHKDDDSAATLERDSSNVQTVREGLFLDKWDYVGIVRGMVLDANDDGAPIDGASVTVDDGDGWDDTYITGEDGAFAIHVPEGTYTVSAEASGKVTQEEENVEVEFGDDKSFAFSLVNE